MSTFTAKIYIINLARAPKRLEAIMGQLHESPFPVEYFAAVDGQTLSQEDYRRLTRKNRYYRPLTKNEVACHLSHRRCLEKFTQDGVDFGIVLEDDAVLQPMFNTALPLLLEKRFRARNGTAAPDSWDVLKLADCDTRFWETDAGQTTRSGQPRSVECRRVPALFLAQVWTPAAARGFLSTYPLATRPVDIEIKYLWEHKLRVYNSLPNLVCASGAASTIGARAPAHTASLRAWLYRGHFILRSAAHTLRHHGLRRPGTMKTGPSASLA
ncbi:MAG: glycosyltransferase family 25 protein [Puniceicoccales bacterium]|jgi:glycosyl transferase family 25|nr:glycosyltransferase family 25 protein [Puniceicoccales bacterium]